jgi:hypothetical protein
LFLDVLIMIILKKFMINGGYLSNLKSNEL